MNKNAIKKFATEARRELISRVGQRALKYGISDKEVGNPNDDSVGGHLLSSTEKKQRAALIEQIKEKGYKQVMEEVAYTWFNRFSALRFMEVNGYLPSRVRVFTDENNTFKPQILTEAIHMELDGLDMEKVYTYKEANDDDELYKYLLITQCNALNSVLPGMFQKISDYTELLFPDNLLREGSVVHQMIELIDEEEWKDAVQIIGWLYQYYNSEKKDDVFAALKKNVKITKENIPAATQLFTPDWIVRYMVENSLGRLWVEGHPNEELKSQWKYYLEEAEQEADVQAQLATIREEYKALKPEDVLCIDPCSGSGHILAYMFDVLVQIYEAYGVDTRSAVASIVENNIYGLDIDERAAQLSYFTVMMKACQYDKRFLRRRVQPHVYAIVESNHVDRHAVDYFCNGDAKLKEAMETIIEELHDAKEYGSIITVSNQDWDALYARFAEIGEDINMSREAALRGLLPLVQTAQALAQKYDVVVTNPPYASAKGLNLALKEYLVDFYPNSKQDFFGAFISKSLDLSKETGHISLVTPVSLLYNKRFKSLRSVIISDTDFTSLVELGFDAFASGFGTVMYSIKKHKIHGYIGKYFDVSNMVEKDLFKKNLCFHSRMDYFDSFDDKKIMYKLNAEYRSILRKSIPLANLGNPKTGMQTNGNSRFLRLWHEVELEKLCTTHTKTSPFGNEKWFPTAKGGPYRKWYGNIDSVVNWKNNGAELREYNKNASGGRIVAEENYFCEGLTWTHTTYTQPFALRYMPEGVIINVDGPGIFDLSDNQNYVLGCMNSIISKNIFEKLFSSIHYSSTELKAFPLIIDKQNNINNHKINKKVHENIQCAVHDWDSFETSWDFKHHPLAREVSTIAEAFNQWKQECESRFTQLKANEEELNRIFIDIYGLQDELTPEVADKDITVYRVFDAKEDVPGSMSGSRYVRMKEDDVVSFISYAVGCMFGRYSLDVDGLAYAGGEWDDSKYPRFAADKDNIIPISDDEYFEDDIVGRFVKFVEAVYGKDTLEENLNFIADALSGNGQPKDVIRKYFLNGFYKDHCKMYQKRPIYWMFDSGKKNGFKCLIYMHRYQPDTLARIRTDYVHEQQARYRTAIEDLESRIANASTSERVKLNKQVKTLNDQAAEIHDYEEKIHHLADQMISIDLDDGVKKNYEIFKDVLAKIK